ncbi:MAG TPA: PEGA domain-containing protein, partial [Myxococcales bacterium]|nr:PEGA domain-containing protein [Myxococcales bacterium]
MLLSDDAQHPGDVTSSNVTPRARWMRRAQYGVVLLALIIAAWAVLSTPKPRGPAADAPGDNMGALAVTVDPADAQLLLDGALVKDAHDAQWVASRLSAGSEHVLTARRDGYSPQSVPLTLKAGETRSVAITLQPSLGDIAVLSSPAGAQVYVDGVRRGTTPAWVPNVDSRADHAVTVEKKCYRTWQVALPARTGRRQVAATLQPAPGACPGHHLETSGMPAPEGLPDEASQASTLGFLNLGSRPSAQVLIDGVDIGQTTPLLAWPLKSGSHQIKLLASDSAKELAVEIRTGETHSEIVDLSPAPATAKKRGRR